MATQSGSPHSRYNPLTGEWVLVSPHRMSRPWQGQVEKLPEPEQIHYDPACYLCPGNTRAGEHQNPQYDGVFVFENDFPALYWNEEFSEETADDLLRSRPENGTCKVICFSPDHSARLSTMSTGRIADVVRTWQSEFMKLSASSGIRYVQIFENRGEMMGCSNPHPHGQIWATSSVPSLVYAEATHQSEYFKSTEKHLLLDYLAQELLHNERIVYANDAFVALVPYWATWPFEILLLPRRAIRDFADFNNDEPALLADALSHIGRRYDALFSVPFPYTMGFHQRSFDGTDSSHFIWHAHYYPPLLRSATVKKFMVGFEMLAGPQRDLTPESAAARLRAAI